MLLQTHITDDEIKAFFEGYGFAVDMIELPVYEKRTHGEGGVYMTPTLHVISNDIPVPAQTLMNEYVKTSILRPANPALVNIHQAVSNILKR